MKRFYSIVCAYCTLLFACVSTVSQIPYTADPSNIVNPIETIKSTIEQQPIDYAYNVPSKLEIDNKCIKLYIVGSSAFDGPISGRKGRRDDADIIPTWVCYKDIGKINLAKITKSRGSEFWRVEIDNLQGGYIYEVFTENKEKAERFIDALTLMVSKIKK